MPAAIAIPALVGVGSTVAGGIVQSKAAKGAAKVQQEAAAKALAFQQQQYQQARQDFDPYLQQGAGAIGRLGTQATATPRTFQPGMPQQLGSFGNVQGQQGAGPMQIPLPPRPQPTAPAPQLPANPGVLGRLEQAMHGANGQPPPMGPSGAMVKVQAPTGEIKEYPPDVAQRIVQFGGRVIQ